MSEAPQELKRIDWSKMPKDTAIRILWDDDDFIRYFSHVSDGSPQFFLNGGTSLSAESHTDSFKGATYKIIENDWKPWFGGECPVPEGLIIEVMFQSLENPVVIPFTFSSKGINWNVNGGQGRVLAYRILGVAEGWAE